MMWRLAGARVRGENYYVAKIEAGQTGSNRDGAGTRVRLMIRPSYPEYLRRSRPHCLGNWQYRAADNEARYDVYSYKSTAITSWSRIEGTIRVRKPFVSSNGAYPHRRDNGLFSP